MQEFLDLMIDVSKDFGLGCVFWLVSFVLPFRKIAAKVDWFWDFMGLVTAVAFGYYAETLLDSPLGWALNWPLLEGWYDRVAQLPQAAIGALYLVLSDFGVYWAHRLLHSRQFWNMHAWHHAPKVVYWAAGQRGSFQDTVVLFSPYSLAFAVFPVLDARTVMITTLLNSVINAHLIHSNIKIPFTRLVERVFVTPRVHFVHHSANKQFGNSNYGKIFTLWDRLFGTYTNPDTVPADQPLGLGYEASELRMMLGVRAVDKDDALQPDAMQARG